MRVLVILAAMALVAAPVLAAPSVAYADGIERPRPPRQRPRVRRPPPPPPAPIPTPPLVIETGPEVVTLSNSFFAGSGGGVGADIGVGGYYSSTTVIIRGSRASASAFAYASARASARGGGWGHGGGCGCR